MGWQLSLGFAIAEFAIFCYLLKRNRYIDVYWVLLLLVVMVQEFCQFVIWKYGVDEYTTSNSCNNINFIMSRILVVFIMALPPIFMYMITKTLYIGTARWISLFYKIILIFELISYLILVGFQLSDTSFCIVIGSNGHLDFIHAMRSDLGEFIPFLIYGICMISYWIIPPIAGISLYQPLWLMFPPLLFLTILFIVFIIIWGTEAYAVWCWSVGFLAIWALIYVKLCDFIRSKYTERQIDATGGLTSCCLKGTHKHFAENDYLAWDPDVDTERTHEIEVQMEDEQPLVK